MNFVRIVIKKTGEVVAGIPIVLQGLNYAQSQEELNNEAWKTAIEDGLVDIEKRADYDFKISTN